MTRHPSQHALSSVAHMWFHQQGLGKHVISGNTAFAQNHNFRAHCTASVMPHPDANKPVAKRIQAI